MGYAWETMAVWPASPEQICQMTARLPRLAEAGGRPELDLAMAGRAGGHRPMCWRANVLAEASGAAVLHIYIYIPHIYMPHIGSEASTSSRLCSVAAAHTACTRRALTLTPTLTLTLTLALTPTLTLTLALTLTLTLTLTPTLILALIPA